MARATDLDRRTPRSVGVERRYISDNGRALTSRTAGPDGPGFRQMASRNTSRSYDALPERH